MAMAELHTIAGGTALIYQSMIWFDYHNSRRYCVDLSINDLV